MAPRKKTARQANAAEVETSAPLAEGPQDERTDATPRLSVPLDGNGFVDWDKVAPKNRTRLRTLMADPAIPEQLGASAPDVGAAGGGGAAPMDPVVVSMLIGSVGSLLVGLGKLAGYDESANGLAFTPDERQALTEPAARVLAKYTSNLGRWEDEVMLAVSVGMVLAPKVAALKKPGRVIPFPASDPPAPPDATEHVQ